jgi:hypothetical protein
VEMDRFRYTKYGITVQYILNPKLQIYLSEKMNSKSIARKKLFLFHFYDLVLKGQSHKNVDEMRVEGDSLGPN